MEVSILIYPSMFIWEDRIFCGDVDFVCGSGGVHILIGGKFIW